MPGLDGLPVSNPPGVFESALAGLPGEGEDATQPRAFLNYIVFDENMVGVVAHRVQVSELAGFDAGEIATPAGLEELQDSVEITTNGYIYVWVSNGSEDTKVWFDDLTVVHTGGLVTQATDYGVWGDVLREERLDETKYRYAYQGQFAELDKETGWSHFESREFDPVIGRWLVPDHAGQHWSPYLAMGNNPVASMDANGELAGTIIGGLIGAGVSAWRGENIWKGALSGAIAGATFDLIVGSAIATGGASIPLLIGAGAASGAVASLSEQAFEWKFEGRETFDTGELVSATVRGVLGPAGKIVGGWGRRVLGKFFPGLLPKGTIGADPLIQLPADATSKQGISRCR